MNGLREDTSTSTHFPTHKSFCYFKSRSELALFNCSSLLNSILIVLMKGLQVFLFHIQESGVEYIPLSITNLDWTIEYEEERWEGKIDGNGESLFSWHQVRETCHMYDWFNSILSQVFSLLISRFLKTNLKRIQQWQHFKRIKRWCVGWMNTDNFLMRGASDQSTNSLPRSQLAELKEKMVCWQGFSHLGLWAGRISNVSRMLQENGREGTPQSQRTEKEGIKELLRVIFVWDQMKEMRGWENRKGFPFTVDVSLRPSFTPCLHCCVKWERRQQQ